MLSGVLKLLMSDWDHCLGGSQGRQRSLHCQNSVFAEGALNGLRVRSLGQQEFSVVFSVDRFAFRFFFVFSVHLKAVIINKQSLRNVNSNTPIICYPLSLQRFLLGCIGLHRNVILNICCCLRLGSRESLNRLTRCLLPVALSHCLCCFVRMSLC